MEKRQTIGLTGNAKGKGLTALVDACVVLALSYP
jgi:hypothetical protein